VILFLFLFLYGPSEYVGYANEEIFEEEKIAIPHEEEVSIKWLDLPVLTESNEFQEEKIIPQLIEWIHHSIEGNHASFSRSSDQRLKIIIEEKIKEWFSGLNFKRIFLNSVRFYHLQGKQGALKNLIPDILTVLALSHTIESTSALWGSALGLMFDLPSEVIAGIVSGGLIISVPGLDPLCYMMVITYGASKKFRNVIHSVRVGFVRTTVKAAQKLGLIAGYNFLFTKEPPFDRLNQSLFLEGIMQENLQEDHRFQVLWRSREDGSLLLALQFEQEDEYTYLKSMSLTQEPGQLSKIKMILRSLALNYITSETIREVLNGIKNPEFNAGNSFFVEKKEIWKEKQETGNDSIQRVIYRPFAIPLSARRRINSNIKKYFQPLCQKMFMKRVNQ